MGSVLHQYKIVGDNYVFMILLDGYQTSLNLK